MILSGLRNEISSQSHNQPRGFNNNIGKTQMYNIKVWLRSQIDASKYYKKHWNGKHTCLNIPLNRNLLGIDESEDPTDLLDTLNSIEFKKPPYPHQIEAVCRAGGAVGFAYFMEQGTGKTNTVLYEYLALKKLGEVERLLIVCPNSVKLVWEQILRKDFGVDDLYISGKGKKRVDAEVFIMNYESVRVGKVGYSLLEEVFGFEKKTMIVADESHYIKNRKASQTIAFTEFSDLSSYRRLLSGTPIESGHADLFSQLRAMDPEYLISKNYFDFEERYCIKGGFKGKQVIGNKNVEEMREILGKVSFQIKKESCVQLPSKIYTQVGIELSKKAQKIFDSKLIEIKEEYPKHPSKGLLVANKLRQLWSGIGAESNEMLFSDKFDFTFSFVNDLLQTTDKVIIWCCYRKEIEILSQGFNGSDSAIVLDGSVGSRKQEVLDKFMEDGKSVLIVQLQSGKEGLTLTNCHNVVYFSHSFSYTDRIQSEDRCHRIGQTSKVNYYSLFNAYGGEDVMFSKHLNKSKNIEKILKTNFNC